MNNKGFTMVEIIAVIMILGLLVIITTPAYNSISSNIKERNYESKKNTIESETLSYVEKYLKDDVYGDKYSPGTVKNNDHCFKVEYLIINGIINSDSETEEYIKDDVTGNLYGNRDENANYKDAFVLVKYNDENFKLESIFTEGTPSESCITFEGE